MAIATRKWSTYERGDTRAVIECEVSGATDANDARASVASTFGFQKGAQFELDSRLVMLENPVVVGDLGLRLVRCEFLLPEFGEPGGGGDDDPLLQPARVQWGRSVLLEPTDLARRVDDSSAWTKMCNINGDGFSPRSNKSIISRTVTITKNLASYPFNVAAEFEEAVNSGQIIIFAAGGNYVFNPGRMQCVSIVPAGEYPVDFSYVPVALTLEIRIRLGVDEGNNDLSRYAFWEPRVNQGRNGWYMDEDTPKYGPICHANGDLVSEDVLLDTGGTPKDTSLKIRGGTIDAPTVEDPVDNPSPPQQNIDFVFMSFPPGQAEIMFWKRYPEKDFTPMFNALNLGNLLQ